MNNAEAFLAIAKSDLNAAICLYKQELYPQTIFFQQQFVEKIMKAYGALSSDIPLGVLKKKVGHNPFMVFVLALQQFVETFKTQSGVSTSVAISEVFEESENDFVNEVRKADKIYKKLTNINGLPLFILRTQLAKILDHVRKVDVQIELDADAEAFVTSANMFLKRTFGDEYAEHIDTICAIISKYLQNIVRVMGPIAFLVLILPASCVQDTRYPSDENYPLEIYSKNHPLIMSFHEITEICVFVSEHMWDILNMFNEIDKIGEQVGNTS